MEPLRKHSLLLIRPGAIGDFLLTIPLLQAFRRRYVVSDTQLLLGDNACRLARALGLAERIGRLGDPVWTPLFADGPTDDGLLRKTLGGFGHILCIMQPGAATRNVRRICSGGAVCVSPEPDPNDGRHLVEQMLARAGFDGFPSERSPWRGGRELVVHPGSGSRTKCWPADRFAAVASRASSRFGLPVALLEGPADADAAQALVDAAAGAPFERIREPGFGELLERLSRAACYVGNDSGITHLAAFLGVPTVAVYGPTDGRVWGPRGPRVAVLQGACPTGRCRAGAFRSPEHCEDRSCLDSVSVEAVLARVEGFVREDRTLRTETHAV
jgi:ADP-heptose:LPS heptosyltransferase